jgi:EAL domain-containing protein (putative c-di-GMP-specific phosphodiesterase class I)
MPLGDALLSEPPLPGRAEALPPDWRRLRAELRQTMREGSFTLAFQGRRRLSDDKLCGAEAQLRWPCRGRGVVQASLFLPVAEASGLTAPLLAWTLTASCRAAGFWPGGTVSVSVPAAAVRDGRLLSLVGDAIAETTLAPHRLEIALAESTVCTECAETLLSVSALRDLGVGLALEDFGRAGACLMKLKRLPVTTVTLDRSLVRDMLMDRAAAALVRTAIDFAHTLDIAVVAAGVETLAQRDFLFRAGCDAVLERTPAAEMAEAAQGGAPHARHLLG